MLAHKTELLITPLSLVKLLNGVVFLSKVNQKNHAKLTCTLLLIFARALMSEHHTYKKIEMVGSSKISIEDAIENALFECNKTVKNMDWFEIIETRAHIINGAVGHYQVSMKIGFKIESS